MSRHSALGGMLQSVARLAQVAIKDVAVANTEFFIDDAIGHDLDEIAVSYGVSGRFGGTSASTYVRLVTEINEDVFYEAGTVSFTSDDGIRFDLSESVTIGPGVLLGFAKVIASITGERGNVPALSINQITPPPTGHLAVSNEFAAAFGSEAEGDTRFRERIKRSFNNCAVTTLARIEEVVKAAHNDVLRLIHMGFDSIGNVILGVVPVNARVYNESDLADMLATAAPYLSLSDRIPYRNRVIGTRFVNISYQEIDVEIRVNLAAGTDIRNLYTAISVGFLREVDI